MADEKTPQPRVLAKYSIFWALALLMVLLGIVPLLVYSRNALGASRSYIEDSLRERQLRTANPAARHVQTVLQEYSRHLHDLGTIFEVSSQDRDVRAAHENLLTGGILDRYVNEDCIFVLYADSQGNALSSPWPQLAPQEVDEIQKWVTLRLGSLPAGLDRPAYSEVVFLKVATQGGLPVPTLAMTLPIRRGGATVATVTGVYFLNKIQTALAEYSSDFSIFITDWKAKDALIFHSDPAKGGRSETMGEDPVVQRVRETGIFPNSATNTSVTALEGGEKRTYLVTYTPLLVLDYEWILFCQVDKGNYLAPISALEKQSWFWVGGLSIISILACFFTARLITRPILAMTEVAQKMSDGDFSARADEGVRNEVGELARAFNRMAKDIQTYIHEVEAKAEENNRLFMNSIRAIANAIDAKDPYTKGHSERVSDYSMIVAKEFGLDERRLRVMRIASLLHDVGKIGIEDKILKKPGALTNEEFGIMKTHPPKGADILASIPEMTDMIPGIKHHHERWGGGGYPDGLKGEQIPLLARIVGVADAFDAMTTNRPYQKAMTFPVAAARVNELVNTVYDPRVVEAFNRAYQKGAFMKFQQMIHGSQQVS